MSVLKCLIILNNESSNDNKNNNNDSYDSYNRYNYNKNKYYNYYNVVLGTVEKALTTRIISVNETHPTPNPCTPETSTGEIAQTR
mmetsp:Transcript_9675/g.10178  ORF Transcript_9675/g.10178 Transcript_9675/m.10178 type:complete len:85 (+) Transcript_9675:84-338(+)